MITAKNIGKSTSVPNSVDVINVTKRKAILRITDLRNQLPNFQEAS